ncbi:hypothetical protein DL89DRAFT_295785 [Linderina pennispora]|uniref:RRM domain-containing protein n=1 Tax=Linderina pennispora TaxID=61395 RepID=A0A1Y1VSC4_9FUNG|nr:uncharacterized protein DL89DRAFT_297817 [Linderina pennispora]XP_040739981.1 uncharacterized protein DL89DRAFT_295785 [Linderina pennispora]ORX64073.1 hypothetical protein DL89DRAFT_297817 [Linderina pennispora]ORX65910.1 hypothetical protein DL89DRAFT_295785 [Linderina pennispora]
MKAFQLVRDLVVKHNVAGVTSMQQSLVLLNHMKKYGSVTNFRFMKDPVTHDRSGMVFVSYQHYDDANQALNERLQIVDGLPQPFNTIEVTPYIRQEARGKK